METAAKYTCKVSISIQTHCGYVYILPPRFVLMVKRSYRDPPYHNWYHALSVAHFCYVLHEHCDHLSFLTDLEVLALFFSCLCHDIDHRGTNNSFQISSVSV